MGQTLNHGVYLPAEGERNCYSGLASNWNLLDAALGDIDGKASATHVHGNITNDGKVGTTANLPLITGTGGVVQAGAFGNQANTFCEGNDSRLSDARTPVAHTHTKSDVTNLFNSANTWTGENTFSNAIYSLSLRVNNSAYESGTPSSNVFYNPLSIGGFVNNAWINSLSINSAIRTNGYNDFSIRVYSQTGNTLTGVVAETNADASIINFRPIANGTHNLGTSSYKWKTFNGINPGALSLPSGATENINTDNWNFSWSANTVTAPFDGYIAIACFGSALQINDETKAYAMTYAPGSDGYICGLLPVSSGDSIKVLVTRTQTSQYEGYKFIKASGNVS